MNNAEATFARHITRVSSDQQKVDSSVQVQPVKESNTSSIGSGSDADDPCITSPISSRVPELASVGDESPVYYSCDDDDDDDIVTSEERTSGVTVHVSEGIIL